MPTYLQLGSEFSGTIVYVGDGDSLCVGVGRSRADGSRWTADFYAPELHGPGGEAAALARIAVGKRAAQRTYDCVAAVCRIGGRSVGGPLSSWGKARQCIRRSPDVERENGSLGLRA
jgi:hypothetical protein